MASVSSRVKQMGKVPNYGKRGKRGKREHCAPCGLFMGLLTRLISMGMFMDFW